MTDAELKELEDDGLKHYAGGVSILKLVTEVRRLRREVDRLNDELQKRQAKHEDEPRRALGND